MVYSKYRRTKRKTVVRRRKSTRTKRKSSKRRSYRRTSGRVFAYLRRGRMRKRAYRKRYRRSSLKLAPAFLAGVNAAADVMHADMSTQTDDPLLYSMGSQTDMPSELGARLASDLDLDLPVRKISADFS